MSAAPIPNLWHRRAVAAGSAKACWICYKPSTTVLITPDNRDHFYVCAGHLKDRAFAIPDAEEVKALEEKRKKKDLEREIELIKKEYEEKQKQKAEKRRKKKKDEEGKEKEKEKEKDDKEAEEDKKDEQEKEAKIKAIAKSDPKADEEEPRIFALSKAFYQQRIDRIRNAEMAKRNRERLKDPTFFPSAPSGDP